MRCDVCWCYVGDGSFWSKERKEEFRFVERTKICCDGCGADGCDSVSLRLEFFFPDNNVGCTRGDEKNVVSTDLAL